MRIFAAGIATETNTFSPIPTGRNDFSVHRGGDALPPRVEHPSLDLSEPWETLAKASGHEFVFGLMAWAPPAGMTTKAAFECLRDEILRDLQDALPVDVVLLMLHGAMIAEGYTDCEQDIICRVRDIAGPEAVIGVEFDLHCHLSEAKIAKADIVITFKEYPHVDIADRARELFDLALKTKRGVVKPTMALFDCRMLGLYPTSREPLRTFVNHMRSVEGNNGVLSVSFGHGFQFGDVSHGGAKVLAVTSRDEALARNVSRELGLYVHSLREQIGFDGISVPMDVALTRALAACKTPVVVADQSDNTGCGAPGDSTFVLRWLMDRKVDGVGIAILHDPEVVKVAKKAGVGAGVSVRLGGKTSLASGDPVDVDAEVLAVRERYMHELPQQSGRGMPFPVGDVAALRCGGVDVIVGSERCQCFSPSIFSDLGIDPLSKRVLIPKSAQHFYAGFAAVASEIIYMAAPGAVTPDPKQISYRHLETQNMFPWEKTPRMG